MRKRSSCCYIFYVQTDTTGNGTTICANAACDSGSNQSTNYTKDSTSLDGEYGLAMDDPDVNKALKIALGALAGFIVGTMVKLSVSLYIIYIIYESIPSLW